MARLLDINPAWYADLEYRDGELASTLTLFQAMQLASILGVRLHELLADRPPPDALIALTELPAHLTAHASRTGIPMDELAARVGGELGEFMDAPLQSAAEVPLIFFLAVADELGIDWLSLVPAEDAA